ncbi:hypothetical protein P3T76_011845 [Phytophthora citrophthora]|uniref:Uncharacterized protein n=1 Tax=Phytophthora citrophthora TaxID=4793 RepID=A0AAD9G895_9STRA|nr:hypothetical protein P3T76_011845 [Phytophthora citrophthora]
MDAERELFIQQLVAALQENTTLSGGASLLPSSLPSSSDAADGSSSSDSATEGEKSPQEFTGLFQSGVLSISSNDSERMAKDAYMQLQFDFPQVQETSIEALAELYRRVSTEKSTRQVAAEIPLTTTLLDGVAYLNDEGPSSRSSGAQRSSRSSEGSGLLAAAIFLLVFHWCLETPEDPQVETLLSSLEVKQQELEQKKTDKLPVEKKEDDDDFVEKFAAQEDPDDLSEVYEGHLPEPRDHRIPMWNHQKSTKRVSRSEKLRFLASQTFSSSFEPVSMEKWEMWRLDDELVAIMRLLVNQALENSTTPENKRNSALYGPRGEWSRYLYVLRDRVLRFPNSSRNALWRLKELIEFLQAVPITVQHRVQPQHLVYRVLAELAISREFHQGAAQRAQQGLALAIQELLPLISKEIHQLVPVPSAVSRKDAPENETEDDGDAELAVVFLQLLHFMLFASPNARTTVEKLHESGMLRTLLMLLPPTPVNDAQKMQQAECLEKRWFPALLRLLGECALWHSGFAGYIVRVPKVVALLPTLREQMMAEELLLALAFHQHQVQVNAPVSGSQTSIDIWESFVSDSVFPHHCESYLEAMKKVKTRAWILFAGYIIPNVYAILQLQDAVFVLDCLEKVVSILRPTMQKELQRSLQKIYSSFAQSFEYPSFEAAEAARQEQQFEQQVQTKDSDDEKKEKKEEDRGQAEALQFTALRNKLRQSLKSLLASLSTGSDIGGRASSKLD